MSLPTCQSQQKFWKQFWVNCNNQNPIGGNLVGKDRKNAILQDCCNQLSCTNPEVIGLPCKDSPPIPGPHFGDEKINTKNSMDKLIGIF